MEKSKSELVEILLDEYGCRDQTEFLEEYILESVVPAVCVECGATAEYEPDQDRGWCEMCDKGTMKSGLTLMDMI